MRRIPQDVLEVLSLAAIEGPLVRLTQQLSRKLYEDTNKVLEALGGQWNRKAKGHVFADDPAERLDEAILSMTYERPKDHGFFPTPEKIVTRLIGEADVPSGARCLEPSAGHGAIAEALAKIVGQENVETVELLPENCEILRAKGFRPQQGNFLTMALPGYFDRIVMNPPFAKQEDLRGDEDDPILCDVCLEAEPQCLTCGCTDAQACQGGCIWATPTLCSRCV